MVMVKESQDGEIHGVCVQQILTIPAMPVAALAIVAAGIFLALVIRLVMLMINWSFMFAVTLALPIPTGVMGIIIGDTVLPKGILMTQIGIILTSLFPAILTTGALATSA